jgi:glycosyltransferase involved in cell wall biosynthesis
VSRVAVVVPARNEAGRIAATVRALRSVPGVAEVVVVDDASTDATAEEATRAGARAIRLRRHLGKGAALARGVAATDADVLVFCDADLGPNAAAVARAVLGPVLAGHADLAVAAPPRAGRPSGLGLVEGFARAGVRLLTGRQLSRPLSGQRALRRAVAEVRPLAGGFGVDAALTVDALRAGYRVVEVPCAVDHRRTGRDLAGFLHRARQGLDVAGALARRLIRAPSRPPARPAERGRGAP